MAVIRDRRIDIIKGICILGVVLIHFGGSLANPRAATSAYYVGTALGEFFCFAVPVFIFLAGFLLGSTPPANGWAVFYRKRLKRLLLPLLVVNFFYLLLTVYADYVQSLTWKNILFRFFYTGIHPTQYFVSVVLQLLLLFPLLLIVVRKIETLSAGLNERRIVLIFGVVFAFIHIIIAYLTQKGEIDYVNFCRTFSPFWLIYFYIGIYAKYFTFPETVFYRIFSIFLFFCFCVITVWNIQHIIGASGASVPVWMAYARTPVVFVNFLVVILLVQFLGRQPGVSSYSNLRVEAMISWGRAVFIIFGQCSYAIYLWHLLFGIFTLWGNSFIMDMCRNYPLLIVFVAFATAAFISLVDMIVRNIIISYKEKVVKIDCNISMDIS